MTAHLPKRSHKLFAASNAQAFESAFEAEVGIAPMQLIARFVDMQSVVCVVLGGSIPLGLATEVSDVDFLVFVRDRKAVKDQPGSTSLNGAMLSKLVEADESSLHVATSIIHTSGIDVDIEFFDAGKTDRLIQRLSGSTALLSADQGRLLSRIKHGWWLHDACAGPTEESLRNQRSDDSLELYAAVKNCVLSVQQLEDAISAPRADTAMVFHFGRLAIERAFEAYLASRGFAYMGSKWMRLVAFLASRSSDPQLRALPELIEHGYPLMFPRFPASPQETEAYICQVEDFLGRVRGEIDTRRRFKVALRMNKFLAARDARTASPQSG